jgi:hypothetical protein
LSVFHLVVVLGALISVAARSKAQKKGPDCEIVWNVAMSMS